MGRGNLLQSALPLTPLPPSPTQVWLSAFRQFEETSLHASGENACSIPFPTMVPRFITLEVNVIPVRTHTFRYYATAQDLLKALVPLTRILAPWGTFTDVLLHHSSTFTFLTSYEGSAISGDLKCTASPCRLPSSFESRPVASNWEATLKKRTTRAALIAATYKLPVPSEYSGKERFFLVVRNASDTFMIYLAGSLEVVKERIAYLFLYSPAFEALYDLDASDQHIPVRLGLRYYDGGVAHELFETS